MDHNKKSRELFRDKLLEITPNVYFQSPSNVNMRYPAIRYEVNTWNDRYANNARYVQCTEYLVTIIDRDPDSKLIEKMKELPDCRYDRHYITNNLHHTVFVVKY